MIVKRYKKRPVVIEAVQLSEDNMEYVARWCGGREAFSYEGRRVVNIPTLEGTMIGQIGDWIIKGISGEFYPCKNDIFEKTYEIESGHTVVDNITAREKKMVQDVTQL